MLTSTNIDMQVAIGAGLPAAGTIREGGIVLSLDATATMLVGIATSTNGTDITSLELNSTNAITLGNKTLAEVIADAKTAAVNDITSGAGAAYDTLLEIQGAIEANDVDLGAILTTQATKVNKVLGKSLVLDTEISRLATVVNTVVVDNLLSISATEVLSAKQGKELKTLIDGMASPTVQSY